MYRVQIRKIDPEHFDPVAAGCAPDLLAGLGMAAAAGHEDVAAAFRKVNGHRLPQSAVGPGDQADLAVDADTLRHRSDRFLLRPAIDDSSGYRIGYPAVVPGSVLHLHLVSPEDPYRMPAMPAPSSGIRNARR